MFNKISRRVITMLVLVLSCPLSTNASHVQVPAPLDEAFPIRLTAGIEFGVHNNFGFGMKNLGAGFAFAHYLGAGFEWGLDMRLNAASRGKLFDGGAVELLNGYGLTLRYLEDFAPGVFLGVQLQADYSHYFSEKSTGKFGEVDTTLAIPFAARVKDPVWLFVSPRAGIFGITPKVADAKQNKHVLDATFGLGFVFGSMIRIESYWLVLEFAPTIRDITNAERSFAMDMYYAVAFDF